jgi:hypothetical protein
MAEYAGYVASTPVNYGEITKDLVNNYIAIDQAKKEEERKTKAELDKNLYSNLERLKDFNLSANPSFNSKVGTLSDGYKSAIMNASKTGGVRAANLVTANALTSINNIKKVQEVIDTNYGEIKKAVSEGKVSKIGAKYAQLYQNALDFSNAEFVAMPDGTTTYVKYDKDGKILEQNSFFDPGTLTSTQPFMDPNVKYQEDLNNWMKSIGSYKNEKGDITIVSPKNNPGFKQAKETKINQLISTDRDTARLLTELGGYESYTSQAEKEELLKGNKFKEEQLIEIQMINGIPQPIISDTQRANAKTLAEQQIDQRVSFSETLDEKRPIRINVGGKEDKLTQGEESILASGDFVTNVIKDIRSKGANTKYAKTILNSISKAGYPLVAGTKLVTNQNGGLDVVDPKGNKITSLNTDEEFYQTLGQKTALQAGSEFTRYKQLRGISDQGTSINAKPTPAPAARETVNVDIKATIAQAAAAGKTITPAQVKAKAMRDNPDKKLRWTNQ